MSYRRILVAHDFSPHADVATGLAAAIVAAHQGELLLYHADGLRQDAAPMSLPPKVWEAYERDRTDQIQTSLDQRAKPFRKQGLTVETHIGRADPVQGIMTHAATWHADLIVMGSIGTDASERLLFGSVAAWVARRAPCPVLVTRCEHKKRLPTDGHFRRPLVCIDYSRFSVAVSRHAAALSGDQGTLQLLHVLRPSALDDGANTAAEQKVFDAAIEHNLSEARRRLCKFAAEVGLADRCTECTVEVGHPANTIIKHLDRADNDLVVLGSHSRETRVEMLLGTVADRVLRQSTAPILLLPEVALSSEGNHGDSGDSNNPGG